MQQYSPENITVKLNGNELTVTASLGGGAASVTQLVSTGDVTSQNVVLNLETASNAGFGGWWIGVEFTGANAGNTLNGWRVVNAPTTGASINAFGIFNNANSGIFEAFFAFGTPPGASPSRMMVDVNGTLVPAPQRQPMPGVPVGWQQVLGNMEHDIQGSIGMYNASLGERSNEKSGRAILARQREGDVATFHFIDNLSRSMRHTGRILIDLIPKIYDTARIARILGEDGESEAVALDPNLPVPVQRQRVVDERGQESIKKIYNLGVGRYDVTITVGPAYTTKRQEAAEAMIQVVQASPNLMSIIGDLMFRNMDWPGADEVAERLKAMLPPQLKDENQDPRLAKAVQMIQALQAQLQAVGKSMQAEEMRIKAFEAMTKRMSAVSEARLDEAKIREIAAGVVQDILTSITPQPLPAVMGGF